jgi:mRNA export factor
MDTAGRLLVIADAALNIHLVDLHGNNPTAFFRTDKSQLKHQTRTIAVSQDEKHWATGGIEGRCGASAVDGNEAKYVDTFPYPPLIQAQLLTRFLYSRVYNFTWRCHRDEPDAKKVVKVWTVNDASYHPRHHGTLATAGSDGSFSFWDLTSHSRLKHFPKAAAGAITAASFSRADGGALFAYAVGYDWSMGCAFSNPGYPLRLMLHPVEEEEINKAARK